MTVSFLWILLNYIRCSLILWLVITSQITSFLGTIKSKIEEILIISSSPSTRIKQVKIFMLNQKAISQSHSQIHAIQPPSLISKCCLIQFPSILSITTTKVTSPSWFHLHRLVATKFQWNTNGPSSQPTQKTIRSEFMLRMKSKLPMRTEGLTKCNRQYIIGENKKSIQSSYHKILKNSNHRSRQSKLSHL